VPRTLFLDKDFWQSHVMPADMQRDLSNKI
jgi:hypothetical protein